MSTLRIIPLGGLGEVGMNIMVIEFGDDMILVDCGLLFPDVSWLGLDIVVPDFEYVIKNKHKLRGLVVTHAHEDHIGAIPFLLKHVEIPIIYCGSFAHRLIEEKCIELGVGDKMLCFDVEPREIQKLGCFEVEFIHVTHSTVQSFALAIRTPLGLVIHSGDFKFDETPYMGEASDKKRLRELSFEKPLILLSDSTNSLNSGRTESEKRLTNDLGELIEKSQELVVVALFASNVNRIQQLFDLAALNRRKVFLSGRSMEKYVHVAISLNLLNVHADLLYPIERIGQFHRKDCLVLSTGSQGQNRSSLQQMAHDENSHIKLGPGDTVILSSRNIPGNERNVYGMINELVRRGVEIHYAENAHVHVSGHAGQQEQIEMLDLVKPQFFLPIHGEPRQMVVHAKTAKDSGFVSGQTLYLENGSVLELTSVGTGEKCEAHILEEKVRVGKMWVFKGEVGSFDDERLKDRKVMARSGAVFVSIFVNNKNSQLICEPSIEIKGFLDSEVKRLLVFEDLKKDLTNGYLNFSPHTGHHENVEGALQAICRRHFKKLNNTRPLVIIQVIRH